MSISAEQLNELHRQFWVKQSELNERRLSDPAICERAASQINWESLIGVPIRWQKSFDQALAEAEIEVENDRIRTRSQQLQTSWLKGGRAPKADALNRLIQEIVRARPTITEQQLRFQLRRQEGQGVITSIESSQSVIVEGVANIHFVNEGGKSKSAPLSGLKDRLARAKAKIDSR